jgi:hypothetical protein
LLYFSDYDSLRDVRQKNTHKKKDRIVNIDKEKYEINSLLVYSCYDFISEANHQGLFYILLCAW